MARQSACFSHREQQIVSCSLFYEPLGIRAGFFAHSFALFRFKRFSGDSTLALPLNSNVESFKFGSKDCAIKILTLILFLLLKAFSRDRYTANRSSRSRERQLSGCWVRNEQALILDLRSSLCHKEESSCLGLIFSVDIKVYFLLSNYPEAKSEFNAT